MYTQRLAWADPLAYGRAIDQDYWVLLHSGAHIGTVARYSILAYGCQEVISSNRFNDIGNKLTHDKACWENAWFGYFGYDLKNDLEELKHDQNYEHCPPAMQWMQCTNIIVFDHIEKTATLHSPEETLPISPRLDNNENYNTPIEYISANYSKEEYLNKVLTILDNINKGNVYQANLTRKFRGKFSNTTTGYNIFERLCKASPAPYSAYMRFAKLEVISSSPEQFLVIDENGNISTQPIKGTAPRHNGGKPETLSESTKDKAENLMIVDLMRNDLARCAKAGSVKVPALFEVRDHNAIYHMSSRIEAKKSNDYSTLDVIKQVFPPGSMTGAPKIAAMQLCSELENLKRGIYSGALGYMGGDGSSHLSVIIRTIIKNQEYFEFQVGGGIVADSDPTSELMETIDKSRGILEALDLSTNIFMY